MIKISHPYICLMITNDSINDELLKKWIEIVCTFLPNGVLSSEQFATTSSVKFYKRLEDITEYYIAVLSRNLTHQEASKIIKNFDNECSSDFEIRWSQTPMLHHIETDDSDVDPNILLSAVSSAAKINHNKWLEKQISNGWRFGSEYNVVSKTSPICRDWDSLSDGYKELEFNRILSLFSVLDQFNLKISKK